MKLSDWMAREGLDDAKVAELVSTDRATVSRIRREINKPSWELAKRFKVVSCGDVTADDFLPGEVVA